MPRCFPMLSAKLSVVLISLAGILASESGAHAGTITFELSTNCTSDCFPLGVTPVDDLGGTITFDDTDFGPLQVITEADIVSFSLTFGIVTISDATALGVGFDGQLNGPGTNFATWTFIASEAIHPSFGDLLILSSEGNNVVSVEGRCITSSCDDTPGYLTTLGNINVPTLQRSSAGAVPEPATLLLLCAGFAGIGWIRRSRSEGPS